jgi:hypothetical protein
MKKILIIIGLGLAFTIGLLYYIFSPDKPPIGSTELEISFVGSQRHNSKDLSSAYSINQLEWFILSSEDQVKNWEEWGYVIPKIDFADHYLIMSKFKILRLYKKPGCDECLGVPDGIAILDKTNSDKDFYYFYLMPKIMLSQGVG